MNSKRMQGIKANRGSIKEIQLKSVSMEAGKPECSKAQIIEQLRTGLQVSEQPITQSVSPGSSWLAHADTENTARQMLREDGTDYIGEHWVTIRDPEDTKSWTSFTSTFSLTVVRVQASENPKFLDIQP